MQQLNLNSQINIAMKKVCANQLTAGMLSSNFSDTVNSFISKDEGYSFMIRVLARNLNPTTFLLNWEFSNPPLLPSFSTPISFPSNIL